MKKISEFFFENFHFLVVKFSVYLNRLVFVMYQNYQQIVHLNKSSVCVSIFLIDEFLNSPSSLRSDVFILFFSLFILDLILLHILCTSRRALKMTINDKSFHKKTTLLLVFLKILL